MNIEIRETKLFLSILESLKTLVDLITIDFDDQGMSIQSMDNSHACLVVLKLGKSFFNNFQIEHNISIGLSLVSLTKIFKVSDTKLIWTLSKNHDDFLNIKIGNTKEYTLILLDIESCSLEVSNLDFLVSLKLNSVELKNIIKELKIYDPDDICFLYIDKKMSMITDSDQGQCKIEIDINEDLETQLRNLSLRCDNFTIHYSFDYLEKFITDKITSIVQLNLSKDNPLRIFYPIENGELNFYLAPKIIDDDE